MLRINKGSALISMARNSSSVFFGIYENCYTTW